MNFGPLKIIVKLQQKFKFLGNMRPYKHISEHYVWHVTEYCAHC